MSSLSVWHSFIFVGLGLISYLLLQRTSRRINESETRAGSVDDLSVTSHRRKKARTVRATRPLVRGELRRNAAHPQAIVSNPSPVRG